MPKLKWDDGFYVKAYRAARLGLSDHAISKALGITQQTFGRWWNEKPAFKSAVEEGRRGDTSLGTFRAFYQQRLSPECRNLYDGLTSPNVKARQRTLTKLEGAGTKTRQHVYLFALIECDLAATKARAVADVDRDVVQLWMKDHNFRRLLDEITECKKDFYEGSFLKLVQSGSEAAIIHAAKTVNRDRGYGELVRVDHHDGTREAARAALQNLSPDELATLAALMEKAQTGSVTPPPKVLIESRPIGGRNAAAISVPLPVGRPPTRNGRKVTVIDVEPE